MGGARQRDRLPLALFVAAGGGLAAIDLTYRWKLQTGAGLDLTPSMHWPEPLVEETVEADAGPVMVAVEYRILPGRREAFLSAVERLARERKRDGAYAGGIFEDAAQTDRFVETFLLDSWLEHLRQHHRVTNADRVLEQHVRKHVRTQPTVTHFIAARPDGAELLTNEPGSLDAQGP